MERQMTDDIHLVNKRDKEIRMHAGHAGCACGGYKRETQREKLPSIEETEETEERKTHTHIVRTKKEQREIRVMHITEEREA